MVRKTLFLVTVLVITVTGQAQIKVVETAEIEEIGEVAPMGQMTAQITKQEDKYIMTYKDAKFIQLNEFKSYTFNEESFNQLYTLIMEEWKNPPKEDIMLEFEDGYLWLSFTKNFGITSMRFAHSTTGDVIGFSSWYTKKQIQRLFGKE